MNSNSSFIIDGKTVGNGAPVYFIADIAANHDGSLERAKKLIYLAAESGADAAKFQHFTANTIVSDYGFRNLGKQISHQSDWKKSVYDTYQDASVNLSWTETLSETCKKAGITFMTSPYSLDLVDHINSFVPAFKIGSGDITWIEMIRYIAAKGKPYLLASGASSLEDVQRAVNAALPINKNFCLMQCNTNYTASLENFKYIQLNVLKTYRKLYPGMVLGLSDHTPGHTTVLGAIALGAKIIEKHFTDDVNREGPDHKFSMTAKSWYAMVNGARELENALGDGHKKIEANEGETITLQRRAIRAARNLKAGSALQREDLEFLRPCPQYALPPYLIDDILDKPLRNDVSKGDCLKWTDLE
jgi:N-acetylneuraminate synthase